jgi:ubiquinone/menaquinone biosynthesis C-methylase UbiE
MKLGLTRRHWNKLARTDPFWAVLTSPDKKENRWVIEEFFADGRETVAAALRAIQEHAAGLRLGSALDFGCGVGRLTQGLARHFARVTGVDISEEMLALARRYNQQGARVSYVHNTDPDLRLFASNQFDLVYSLITLQHMEPPYARKYIAEFVRVAAPGGIILFQMPSQRLPEKKENTLLTHWPPTLFKRIRRRLRRRLNVWFAFDPLMEMHAIPQDEVRRLLEQNGAAVLQVTPYQAAGELESWAYLARKL